MSKIVKKTTRTDTKTGEIVEEEKIINFGKTSDFVMTFTKDLGYMKNLTKGEIVLTFGLLQIVNNNNEIILNKSIKQRICKDYEINLSSFNVMLSNLLKKQIIQQKDRGIYLINTYLFGKGSWGDIKKIRMFIEWDFKEKTKKMMVEQDYLNEEEKLLLQKEKLENELNKINVIIEEKERKI